MQQDPCTLGQVHLLLGGDRELKFALDRFELPFNRPSLPGSFLAWRLAVARHSHNFTIANLDCDLAGTQPCDF